MNNSMRITRYLWITGCLLIQTLIGLNGQDTLHLHGIVKSSGGDPVQNVSISIDGSTMPPVITDVSGEFTLTVPSGKAWLLISPTGDYKQRRIYLNNRKEITIFLSNQEMVSGDDPLIILSLMRIRRDLVTSHTELNSDNFPHSSAVTIDQYMQGRVPGMEVINRSGDIGSGAVTKLRGIRSIYATNQPLYIIDGIPLSSPGLFESNLSGFEYNPLLSVNPFDISSINIIKDPVYGAAYGSKGSNGIIFIETLDPSVTQTSIEVNARAGYSLSPDNLIPQMNASQHKTLMNEILFSSGMWEEDIRENYPSLFLEEDDDRYIDYLHNTDWQRLIFQNSSFYGMNLKVKGGDEIARYGLSFGYMSGDGIIQNTGFNGYNLRFVSLLNIFTWLKMNAGVSLNYNSASLKESALGAETSPILASLAKSPLLNPYQYDIEGKEISELSEVDDIGISNPLAVIENYTASNTNYNFIATLGIEGTINRYMRVISKFSLNYDVLKELQFLPNKGMERYYNQEAFNVSKASNNDLNSLYNNTSLLFSRVLGTDHSISSNTGVNILSNKYQFDWGLTKNAHENDEYRALQDGQNNLREIGGNNRNWNWVSFYENVSYSFRDKYLLSASLSLDGSSRLGDEAVSTIMIGGQPFGLFYSAGLAWRLSNEPFLRNLPWIENLKLRIAAGKTGNDDIGEISAKEYYEVVKFRQTTGLFPALLTNHELTYETVGQINGGIDVSLLGNRFMVTADYFTSKTDNMIIFTPIDAYFGYDFIIENGGQILNHGVELSTFMRIIDHPSFHWDIQANFTKMSNEVAEVKGNKLIYDVPGGQKIIQEGFPANSFYGYVYQGVFSSSEQASGANLKNYKGIPYGAGDAMYEDLSGPYGTPDGFINEYDKTVIGSPEPDHFGGLTNVWSFKRWTLSTTLYYTFGNEIFNYLRYKNEEMSGLSNQSIHVLNRWQYEGMETDVPRASWNDPMGNADFSTRWIEDGSYFRVKNISLYYRVPDQFLLFKSAEFYISVSNIFTQKSYLGYDPEFAYSSSPLFLGIDYGLTPQPRQFIAGIKIGL